MTEPYITNTVVVYLTEVGDSGWLSLGPVEIKSGDSGLLLVTPNGGMAYQPFSVTVPDGGTCLLDPITITISDN
jgi:hypothetical protein